MIPTMGYLSLYYKLDTAGSLEGITGIYVDDYIGVTNTQFEEFSKRTERNFDLQPRIKVPLTFAGIIIDRENTVFIMRHTR